MKAIKVFAVAFFLLSVILFAVSSMVGKRADDTPWIKADQSEVTVSVKDDRISWAEGITAGVGDEERLTDRVHLTYIGDMDEEGCLDVIYTVTDDSGKSASLHRKVCFSDYTPPSFTLLRSTDYVIGSTVNLSELILVSDPLDGNITHLVKTVSSDVDTTKAGSYEMKLTVRNSYGVSTDYTLNIHVI